jgi:hypothetical protein
MKPRTRRWTDPELIRLARIIAAGGTPVRAAAALNRRIVSCQKQARKMGTPFTAQRIARKNIREKCEAAARGLRPTP